MSEDSTIAWQTRSERTIYEHQVLRLKSCQRSRGGLESREFVLLETPPWVNVVATTAQGEMVLIRQWRHGIQAETLEIPGGLVDPGEEPMAAGARELLEETGYKASRMLPLGWVHSNPALFNNRCYTFWAQDAFRAQAPRPEDTEDIEVCLTPRKDLPDLITNGRITHSLVVAALSLFWLKTAALKP